MSLRLSTFAPTLVVVLSIGVSACEDRPAILGASPTAAVSGFESRLVSVGPARIGRTQPPAIPTSPAVPIPSTLPFQGTVGLVLGFDCGVPAEGTLFIDLETAGRDSVVEVSHLRVRVG